VARTTPIAITIRAGKPDYLGRLAYEGEQKAPLAGSQRSQESRGARPGTELIRRILEDLSGASTNPITSHRSHV
jgi:hypothetical protein